MFSPSNGFSAIRPCKASALYGSQREASTSRKITERKELMMGCRRPLTGLFKLLKKKQQKKNILAQVFQLLSQIARLHIHMRI